MTTAMDAKMFKSTEALLELSMLNAETSDASFDDVMVKALKRGVPPEIVTRLSEVWEKAWMIGGELVSVGKIVVIKIVDFLMANPTVAIGVALGACATTLVASIPLVGPVLAPLTANVFMLYGAGVGATAHKGDYSLSPVTAAIALAQKFFELLIAVFNGVKDYWNARGEA